MAAALADGGTTVGCNVCLSEVGAHAIDLRCGHRFCVACLRSCARHNLLTCPTCRRPHDLDPDELKARLDRYRELYRSWRAGGVKGAVGDVGDISTPRSGAAPSAPPSPDAVSVTSSSKPSFDDHNETAAASSPASKGAGASSPAVVAAPLIPEQCKAREAFRDYAQPHARSAIVEAHYRAMRQHQTVAFVRKMHAKYSFADGRSRARMTVREAFAQLEGYVDSSDPDLGLPNLVHCLQTAEAIRKAGHPDWFALTGLLHDMGKIMFLWGTAEDGQRGTADGPQWALGGDTFVVGCALPAGPARPGVTFPEFNALNPDSRDDRYNSKCGMYAPRCGLDNLLFAYGHDEYAYQMLVANATTLPKQALAMVRYHSAYPWHTARVYDHLMAEDDYETLDWVLEFNKFDLYTKDEGNLLDLDAVWPYYQAALDKYGLGGTLKW